MSFNKQGNKMIKSLNNVLCDIAHCLRNGTLAALILSALAFILGVLFNSFNIMKAIEAVRSTLLIVGPLGVIVGSLLILFKKSEKEFKYIDEWKEKFKVLSYKIVIIMIGFTITFFGCIVDYILVISH